MLICIQERHSGVQGVHMKLTLNEFAHYLVLFTYLLGVVIGVAATVVFPPLSPLRFIGFAMAVVSLCFFAEIREQGVQSQ